MFDGFVGGVVGGVVGCFVSYFLSEFEHFVDFDKELVDCSTF